MKLNDFFHDYANVPVSKRFVVLDFGKGGLKTFRSIYEELDTINNAMRPLEIRKIQLLGLAEKGFEDLKK